MDELITKEELRQIMPRLSSAKLDLYTPHLNSAMKEFEIDNANRIAAFIAQVAHESAELHYMEEIASGAAYEGRRDLGNTKPGDGKRFKGRGPIQTTGRANYAILVPVLGVDVVANPELLATPEHGFRSSAYYWKSHGLNEIADNPTEANFKLITRKINGGYNGLADRISYWKRAKNVLYASDAVDGGDQ